MTEKQQLVDACRRDPDDASHWRRLGEYCLAEGDTAGVREAYTQVARLQPSAEAHAIVGSTWLSEGEFGRAVVALRIARSLDISDPEIASALGCAYFHAREFAAAKPLLIEAAKADPENETAYMALARIAVAEQDFPSALEICSLVLKSDPVDALSPMLVMGDCFLALGSPEQACTTYQLALEVSPDNVTVLVGLAAIYLLLGDHPQAEGQLRRALQLDPGAAAAHAGLGNLHLMRDLTNEAVDEYGEAARLEPTSAGFQGQLAAALLVKGQPREAEVVARNGLKIDATDMGSLLVAAQCAELNGRFTEAADFAEQAVELQPQHFHARLIAARALLRLGHREDAKEHLESALEYASTDRDKAKVEKLLHLTQPNQ